jgi:hypothetical protein
VYYAGIVLFALLALGLIAVMFYLFLRARARRRLNLASAAYDAERWAECVGHYRDYLLLAARTLKPEARNEILRQMAFAALTGDLAADVRPAIIEFRQLDALAPRRRAEREAHAKYYAAYGRLLFLLRSLDLSPRGPESEPREKICFD